MNVYRGRVSEDGSIPIEITPAMEIADQALRNVSARIPGARDCPELRHAFAEEHAALLRQAFEQGIRDKDEARLDEVAAWMDEAEETLEWTLQTRAGCFRGYWRQFMDRAAYEQAMDETFAERVPF